jgi:hypothetical protein
MPTYTFKNKRTGKTKEYTLKISEYDKFKEEHPNLERVIDNTIFNTKPAGFGSVTDQAVKKNAGWGEVLSKIGQQNPHSVVANDHHRNKSIKRIRSEQIVEKHAKKQAKQADAYRAILKEARK